MSYATVEAGLLAVIRLHADYNTTNSSAGDYRLLGSGKSKIIILTPGLFTQTVVAAPRRMGTSWSVNLELFIPFQQELSNIASNIRSVRQTLMDQINKYPHLNDTAGVIDAIVEGGSEPELWQGENRRWWVQKMRCVIKERVIVTIAE